MRPAEMIAFRETMPTHTDMRARALVSANIDERIHTHADRARVCADDYLRASERTPYGTTRGGRFNIPTVYSSGSVDIGYRLPAENYFDFS